MKIIIEICSISKRKLVKELIDITEQIKSELESPICKNCLTCKDKRKGCYVGGGSSEVGLESDWKLKRIFNEHKVICKSKVGSKK